MVYRCTLCHEEFESTWDDAAARAEAEGRFRGVRDLIVVCDDCYRAVLAQEWSQRAKE